MKYVPHDYQAYCIQRVVEDPAVGLFLRPGLGKTVITLSAVNILKYFRWQVQKVLVVAPKKVAEIILPSLIQRTGIIKKCAFAV